MIYNLMDFALHGCFVTVAHTTRVKRYIFRRSAFASSESPYTSSSGHAEQVLFSSLGSKVAVYRRKLQWFFLDLLLSSSTRSTDIRVHRAGSQLKMSESQTKAGNQKKFENLKILKFKKSPKIK